MKPVILLTVTHPSREAGPIEGFRFLWAFYVNGYRVDRHCQPGLKGKRVDEFKTGNAFTEQTIVLDRLDRYPYVYICGVGKGPKSELWKQNLHMPLRFKAGSVVEMPKGEHTFSAKDAELVEIPGPFPSGWNGITDAQHLRCKNFRFAVGVFGAPE
jgi:hypothetical protein